MLQNLTLLAFRNLLRHKTFSFINILGLAIGLAASILLLGYVSTERSYDDVHTKKDNIYRVRFDNYKAGDLKSSSAIGYYGAAPEIKAGFPEVLDYVRFHRADGMYTYSPATGQPVSHHETKAYYADAAVFSVFDFELLEGNKSNVLSNPKSIAISATAAKKYFNTENPIGKTLSLTTEWEGGEYQVTGVFKDVPENSHIKFDFLLSIDGLLQNKQFKDGAWYWWNFYTYLLLRPETNHVNLELKFPGLIEKFLGKQLKRSNSQETFTLQPLSDIHLHSNLSSEAEVNGNHRTVSVLLILSFIIIGIAWLNYVNLSTAKATERAREVGVRRLLGSNKKRLILQFFAESLAVTSIAIVVAIGLVFIAHPFFNQLIGRPLSISFSNQLFFWISTLLIIITGTLLAGLYPAFKLSSFQPITALKGKIHQVTGGINIRKSLIVFQFFASAVLIVATLTIFRQLEFMRNQDLGMDIQQKIVIRAPKIIHADTYVTDMDYFKKTLKSNVQVASVSISSEVPGKEVFWTNEIRKTGEPETVKKIVNILAIDEDYIPTYDMTLLAGRNFTKDLATDPGESIIINESAIQTLGFISPEAAINQSITIGAVNSKRIVGVIRDFHQQSLKQENKPTIFNYIPWDQSYITISMIGKDIDHRIAGMESIFHTVFPNNAFEYFFLDEQFNLQYQADEREWKLFVLFAVLSVFVAGMGLFGLSSFVAIQRAKELAIRKVLGASVLRLSILLSTDFIKLILFALLFAVPLSWYLMKQWLMNFAYHIEVPWTGILIAALLTVFIALLTVGSQTLKAAITNPVDSLKSN